MMRFRNIDCVLGDMAMLKDLIERLQSISQLEHFREKLSALLAEEPPSDAEVELDIADRTLKLLREMQVNLKQSSRETSSRSGEDGPARWHATARDLDLHWLLSEWSKPLRGDDLKLGTSFEIVVPTINVSTDATPPRKIDPPKWSDEETEGESGRSS